MLLPAAISLIYGALAGVMSTMMMAGSIGEQEYLLPTLSNHTTLPNTNVGSVSLRIQIEIGRPFFVVGFGFDDTCCRMLYRAGTL